MATNFLIALATAFGSATLILLVLRVALKVVAPNAFKEMIVVPAKTVEGQFTETTKTSVAPMKKSIIDAATLVALSGHQIVDLSDKADEVQVVYNYSPAIASTQASGLLTGKQRISRVIVFEAKVPKKIPTIEEILSPSGQSIPHRGSAVVKESLGVHNEALCGSAR
jgi:hypothetical protein